MTRFTCDLFSKRTLVRLFKSQHGSRRLGDEWSLLKGLVQRMADLSLAKDGSVLHHWYRFDSGLREMAVVGLSNLTSPTIRRTT